MNKIPEHLHIPPTFDERTTRAWRRELQYNWMLISQLINACVTLYYQDAEPTIADNTFAMWVDTNAGPKYYMIANFGGTQKKVEFT